MQQVYLKEITTDEQIGEVSRMAGEIWREHYASVISAGQIEYMLENFQSARAIKTAITADGYEYYFIMADGKEAGYIGIKKEKSDRNLFLSKFYLLKEARGKGYARQAIRLLVGFAREARLQTIRLTVNKENSSVEAYKALGFKAVKSVVADIGNGFFMDDYIMEKAL